ncbi:hypothetical protein D0C36_02810 [Mucilaginibacter conchicola]|uniref:DUF6265 domain-containing protein n=1 Tax=Mucilaginibacter conchicola TaxID=2303333 RepID=A0A372NWK4_9SPHI|nr:DUF6265 family protein [Mucilaginibacter conchicola]RFZ94496.1 hypothetical protein D0C36_02810 [Mucilaginibacter conchicola]
MKKTLLILIIVLYSTVTYAQTKASVNNLSFMAGNWALKHKWGDMQEIWGKPMGDNIVSVFRCVKDGKVVFYEFMTIEQSDKGPVLQLRHFNKGSIGWEDKDKPYLMPATSVEKNKVVFTSEDKKVLITYVRLSPQKMDCILDEQDKTGKWTKETFSYTLSKR